MTCTRTWYLLWAVPPFHGNSQTFVHQGGDCKMKFPSRWYTLLGTDHVWVSLCFMKRSGGTALWGLTAQQGRPRCILPRCEHPSWSSQPQHHSPSAIQRNPMQLLKLASYAQCCSYPCVCGLQSLMACDLYLWSSLETHIWKKKA